MTRRESTQFDYTERINRAVDFLYAHQGEPASLARLAKIAAFSRFHFHRVFRSVTGQTVARFQARLRVERAALLLGRAGSQRALTDIAAELGFSSSAEFSRSFRAHFSTTPSAFRTRHQQMRKPSQTAAPPRRYVGGHAPTSFQFVSHPERRVAFIRVSDCFSGVRLANAHRALQAWAEARGVRALPLWGISHDDPDITPASQCRYDLGFEVAPHVRGSHGVATRLLPACDALECTARGGIEALSAAWEQLFAALPSSGFEPANAPGIERYFSKPDFVSFSHFDVVVALPVVASR